MPPSRRSPGRQPVSIALVVGLSALAGLLVPVVVELALPRLVAHTPEQAARAALRAVHERDYSEYASIALNRAEAVRAGAAVSGAYGDAMEEALRPDQEARLRAEFERLVNGGQVDAAAAEDVVATTVPQNDGTWRVELFNQEGAPLGVSVVVADYDGGYRVSAMSTDRAPIQ